MRTPAERLSRDDPLTRRWRLTRSLSWRLFLVATGVSLGVFGWAILELQGVRSWQAVALVFAVPACAAVLSCTYLWWIFTGPLSWQEGAMLFFLRLTLWVGCLWQLVCTAYLTVALLLSRGFVIWLPS